MTTATMIFAAVGTVSHGTLRTADLLDTFACELEHLVCRNADAWCSDEGRKLRDQHMKLIGDAREIDPDHEDAGEIVSELQDALQSFAAPGCYFGTTEGDGSDFGFWQLEDEQ
jgi:hypothetical protein